MTRSSRRSRRRAGFTPERVQELLDLIEDPVSLETPVGDGESIYGDLIEDTKSDPPGRRHRQAAALDASWPARSVG